MRRETTPRPRRADAGLLRECPLRGDLLCGTIEVPLDRAEPEGETIPIAFYVHRHTAEPAAEPVFVTPGGPGSGAIGAMDVALAIDTIVARHDIVAVDPRGTGSSGAIDCPDLQDGWNGPREQHAAVAACGEHLGAAADRYGAGDVALDVEAVRRALGYDRIDYYAFSYGSVPEQAYAARFPERLHALVLDAGMTVTDPDHVWAWRLGLPDAFVRAIALMCSRGGGCGDPDPAETVRWFVRRAAGAPIRGEVEVPGGESEPVAIDEVTAANLLQAAGTCTFCGQIAPARLVGAIARFRAGDPELLLRLASLHVRDSIARGPDPGDFSVGASMAALCNDQDFVWNRGDPIDVRRAKFRDAVAAFAPDAFAPFTVDGWRAFIQPEGCLAWPAPDRFEPVVPAGSGGAARVPTLILAGDDDTIVPVEVVATLRNEFPLATFVTVAGAGHPVARSAWGECAAQLVGQLFEALRVTDASCADMA